MSDAIKYIDVDDEQFEDAPKALRDAYKALARQHKDATTELGQARTTIASHALGDVLGTAGFKNPKRVEQDILRDGIDATSATAVQAWLTANADDYAKADGAPVESKPEQTEDQQRQQAAHQQLAAGSELRQPADTSKWDLAQSEITPDMDGAAVREVFKKHGI